MQSKRKNAHRALNLLLFLLILLLLLALAGGLILWRMQSPERTLVGEWRMSLDLTEQAVTEAKLWLGGAELGNQVDPAGHFPALRAEVCLRLNSDGSWERHVDEASYTSASGAACEALAASLRDLLQLRIEALGRGGGTDEYVEARIRDTVGMPTAEYLRTAGPQLLPALDVLRAQYDGAGSYVPEDGQIRFSDGRAADFLVSGTLLVLRDAERTEVYVRDGNS